LKRFYFAAALLGLLSVGDRSEAGYTYFDFSFSSTSTSTSGHGTLATLANGNGTYTAVSGSLTDNVGDTGSALIANPNAPNGATAIPGTPTFFYDDQLAPNSNPSLTFNGLLFAVTGSPGEVANVYFNGPSYGIFISNASGATVLDDHTLSFTVSPASVPEPSSLVLCGSAGIIGLGFARMRRERAAC
jgi:hypothetical protein